ncbi:MAG: protein kinase [Polyangiales bacterium]
MRGAAEQAWASTSRFRLRARLGDGGGGIVYRAYDRAFGREVAVKFMHRRDGSELARLCESFAMLRRLAHPNLVQLHDLVEENDRVLLVMELVEGVDLLSYVRTGARGADASLARSGAAQFDELRVRAAFGQLAQGLCALHRQGKVHRDVKPDNVRVTDTGRLALLDLDLALDVEASRVDRGSGERTSARPVGTALYMAPEQAGFARPTTACDWYSVGVVLYEALTGTRPYTGTDLEVLLEKQLARPLSPRALVAGLPGDLERLCVDLLSPEPSERPTGPEVLRRLGVTEDVLSARWTSASLLSAHPTFVGREPELAAIDGALDRARHGPVVLRVRGEAGLGKTSLCEEALRRLARRERNLLGLTSACPRYPERAHAALHEPVARAVDALRRAHGSVRLPVGQSALRLLERMFPGALVDVGVKAHGRTALPPDPLEQRQRALTALRALFAEVAAERPVVLWLDDYQWADVDTQRLVSALVAPPDGPRVLVLLSEEPEPGALEASRPLADLTLPLSQLTPAAASALADELLARSGGTPAGLAPRTDGSPLLLQEHVRNALLYGVALPGDVDYAALVAPRIDGLEEPALRVLQLVCAAYDALSLSICERASGLTSAAFTRHVAALSTLGLVRATRMHGEDCLAPGHARLAEHVDYALSGARRARIHERLAEALAARDATRASSRLLRHQVECADLARAAESAEVAAQQAHASLAFQRAAQLFTLRASLVAARSDEAGGQLLRRMGDTFADAGWALSAAQAYRDAADRSASTDAIALRQRALDQLLRGGELTEACQLLDAQLDALGMQKVATVRGAEWSLRKQRLGQRLWGVGFRERDETRIARRDLLAVDVLFASAVQLTRVDAVRGAELLARALARAREVGEPRRVARALCVEAWSLEQGGAADRSRSAGLLAGATALGERHASPLLDGHRRLARGMLALADHHARECSIQCRDAERVLRDSCGEVAWEVGTAQVHQLLALTLMARHAEVADKLAMYLHEADERGDLWTYTNLLALDALGPLLARARPDEAAARLAEAESRWNAGAGLHSARLLRARAATAIDLYRAPGDAHERLVVRRTALERAGFLGVPSARITLLELSGRTALASAVARGDASLLREADACARRLVRERDPAASGFADLLRAGVYLARGGRTLAARCLVHGIAKLEPLGLGQWTLPARVRLAELSRVRVDEDPRLVLVKRGVTDVERFVGMMLPAG